MKKNKSVEVIKFPKNKFRLSNWRMNSKPFDIGMVQVINETKNDVSYDLKLPNTLVITFKKRSPLKPK